MGMKRYILLGLVLSVICSCLSVVAVSAADTTAIAPVSYGIDNLNNNPGDLYVAYIGGSITQGEQGISNPVTNITYKDGAGSGHPRWSSQLTKRYFQKKYPNKNVIEVNAGIGGTTSDQGLYRLDNDVVKKSGANGPDVVFVEFAVNDVWYSVNQPDRVRQTMEGIVRQLARLPKQPVVIFVLTATKTTTNGFTDYLTSGNIHKEVADYYGIGYIDLCSYVSGGTDIEGNSIVWDKGQTGTWTNDNCHPSVAGYTGYTDYIIHCFDKSFDTYFKKLTWKNAPMSGYEFGKPEIVAWDELNATYTGNWEEVGLDGTANCFQSAYKTTESGATVTFKFTGRSFGLYAARGYKGAQASYIIDAGTKNEVRGVISNYYSGTDWLPIVTKSQWDLAPGEHTVKLTVSHPSSSRNEFIFGYFLLDETQPDPIISKTEIHKDGKAVSTADVDDVLTASYSFVNALKEEKSTKLQWLVCDREDGEYTEINGETGKEFAVDASYAGRYVKLRAIPESTLGTKGLACESEAVRVVPSSLLKFIDVKRTEYYDESGLLGGISEDEMTVKTKITNKAELLDVNVAVMTCEYEILADGTKKLVKCHRTAKTVGGGKTEVFEDSITAGTAENREVRTFVTVSSSLEPLAATYALKGGELEAVQHIESSENDEKGIISVYQINSL